MPLEMIITGMGYRYWDRNRNSVLIDENGELVSVSESMEAKKWNRINSETKVNLPELIKYH
jgi:hypothetical protein